MKELIRQITRFKALYPLGVQRTIVAEMRNSTSCRKHPMLTGLVDTLIGAIQVGYDDVKEGVNTPVFILVGDVIVDIIQQA